MKTKNITGSLLMATALFFFGTDVFSQQQNIEVKLNQVKGGWGYDIIIDGHLTYRQENIPALQGNYAFKSEADARKTAALAVSKIRKNIMPPSITPEELDSLNVIPEEAKSIQPKPEKSAKPVNKPEKEHEIHPTPK